MSGFFAKLPAATHCSEDTSQARGLLLLACGWSAAPGRLKSCFSQSEDLLEWPLVMGKAKVFADDALRSLR
jgi:hypothetical protein